ncbi:MAG: hypothetical protein V1822_00530 [Candidatus Micrarchaeota archaeon]
MMDEEMLKKLLAQRLFSPKNGIELSQRALASKWTSFATLYFQMQNEELAPFISKRKNDLAHFYLQNPKIAKSFEATIDARERYEQKPSGLASDELGLFLGGFCSTISSWSRLLRHMAESNHLEAAKGALAQIETADYSLDEQTKDVMLNDMRDALSTGGTIIGPLDAMLACQQAIAPAIVQNSFLLTKTEDELYVSQRLTPLPPLADLRAEEREIPRKISQKDSRLLLRR